MNHKVLLVTTSQSRPGGTLTTAGSWLEEQAAPSTRCSTRAPIDAASVVEP